MTITRRTRAKRPAVKGTQRPSLPRKTPASVHVKKKARSSSKAVSQGKKTLPKLGRKGIPTKTATPRARNKTSTPKPSSTRRRTFPRKKRTYELGAEDDSSDVSFGSGLLDENVCFTCGIDTRDEPWDRLILCDACEGEYHLACVDLDLLPRRKFWHCPYCLKDSQVFADIPLQSNSVLGIGKTSSKSISLCYTPSKPLEVAWAECLRRGYMCVKSVFSHDIIMYSVIIFLQKIFYLLRRKLTRGNIEFRSTSNRLSQFWPGAYIEFERRMNLSCKNLVIRGGTV